MKQNKKIMRSCNGFLTLLGDYFLKVNGDLYFCLTILIIDVPRSTHLFRHQILTYLMSKGIVDEKIKLISGHKNIENLSIYHDLSIADVEKEYWDAMKDFPIQ